MVAFERTKCPPWGLFGGKPGQIGGAFVRQPGENAARGYRKITALPLKAGAIVELFSAGGGGRGQPFTRPVERVLEDVRQEYVTVEGARRDYAVVVDRQSLVVDPDATAVLRSNWQLTVLHH